jgi:hypothetical protein
MSDELPEDTNKIVGLTVDQAAALSQRDGHLNPSTA